MIDACLAEFNLIWKHFNAHEMNDKYLDSVLITIIENDGQSFKEQDLLRTTELGDTDDFDPSIRLLTEHGYISIERLGHDYLVQITLKGKRFIEMGGFQAESQRNDAAAQANQLAKRAILISIIAIVVSAIMAFLVAYMELFYRSASP